MNVFKKNSRAMAVPSDVSFCSLEFHRKSMKVGPNCLHYSLITIDIRVPHTIGFHHATSLKIEIFAASENLPEQDLQIFFCVERNLKPVTLRFTISYLQHTGQGGCCVIYNRCMYLSAVWHWGRFSLEQKWVPGIFPGA